MDKLHELTKIDPWFIHKMKGIIGVQSMLEAQSSIHDLDRGMLLAAKRKGFSDKQIASLVESSELVVRSHRQALGKYQFYIKT